MKSYFEIMKDDKFFDAKEELTSIFSNRLLYTNRNRRESFYDRRIIKFSQEIDLIYIPRGKERRKESRRLLDLYNKVVDLTSDDFVLSIVSIFLKHKNFNLRSLFDFIIEQSEGSQNGRDSAY